MDNNDWDAIWAMVMDLWPKQAREVSEELQSSYFRVCHGFTFNHVQRAVRAFSEHSKWFPKPYDLRKQLKASKGDDSAVEAKPLPTRVELIRQNMDMAKVNHDNMTDNQCQLWYWSSMVVQASKTYDDDEHAEVQRCIAKREHYQDLVDCGVPDEEQSCELTLDEARNEFRRACQRHGFRLTDAAKAAIA